MGHTIAGLLISLGLDATKLQAGLIKTTNDVRSWASTLERTLDGISRKLDLMGRLGTGLHSIFQGVGIALGFSIWGQWERVIASAVALLPRLIDQGIRWGETIENLQNMTGATAETASRFTGVMEYLGIGTEDLARRIGQLSRNVTTHQLILDKLGITVKDANGHYLDQITIIDNVRSALSKMQAGVTKTAVEIALFGRGGFELADYFELTDAQIQLLNETLDRLGVTLDENAVQRSIQARREMNLFGLAVQGLANRLFIDVAPALISAVDALVRWVEENGKAIADFAAKVVNFVLGMVAAITGAEFQTVTFTQAMINVAGAAADAGTNIDEFADNINDQYKATKASTDAIQEQIDALREQIDVVEQLDKVSALAYSNRMDELKAELEAQLDLLDAKEKEIRDRNTELQNAQRLEDAKYKLAEILKGDETGKIDYEALHNAQNELTRIQQDIALQQTMVVDDARRQQIENVQKYIDSIEQLEKDAVDKKKLAEQLATKEKELNVAIAAAKEKGDLQAVADLTTQLEAVKAAEVRTAEAIKNQERIKGYEDEIDRLEELKRNYTKTLGPGGDVPKAIGLGLGDVRKMFGTFGTDGVAQINKIGGAIGPGENSLIGALEDARRAGEAFGKQLHDALVGEDGKSGILKALQDVAGIIATVYDALNRSFDKDTLGSLLGLAGISKLLGLTTGPGALLTLPLILEGDTGTSSKSGAGQKDIDWMRKQDPNAPYDVGRFGTYGGILKPGMTYAQAIEALIKAGYGHSMGGWVGLHGPELGVLGEKSPEYVVTADKMLGRNQPGGLAGLSPDGLVVVMDGTVVGRLIDERLDTVNRMMRPNNVAFNVA